MAADTLLGTPHRRLPIGEQVYIISKMPTMLELHSLRHGKLSSPPSRLSLMLSVQAVLFLPTEDVRLPVV